MFTLLLTEAAAQDREHEARGEGMRRYERRPYGKYLPTRTPDMAYDAASHLTAPFTLLLLPTLLLLLSPGGAPACS